MKMFDFDETKFKLGYQLANIISSQGIRERNQKTVYLHGSDQFISNIYRVEFDIDQNVFAYCIQNINSHTNTQTHLY